jgi:asparagine N-glycosylation enzyme membrane subunit Stt3
MENWYLPITILPGIGLLILSTTHLIVSLNEEMESLLKEVDAQQSLMLQKLSQMKLLTYSMSGFYISTALMVLSGLVSFSQEFKINAFGNLGSSILVAGVAFIFISLLILIIYSVRAVRIRRKHFKKCLAAL